LGLECLAVSSAWRVKDPEGPGELRVLAKKKLIEQQMKVLLEKVTRKNDVSSFLDIEDIEYKQTLFSEQTPYSLYRIGARRNSCRTAGAKYHC